MVDLLTPQALAAAGPLVFETLFKHVLLRNPLKSASQAREDLMYDEAFVLMKTFMEVATTYPVATLQHFGLVRTPAPPWVGLHRVLIPQHSLTMAAESLVKGFGGEEMAYKIAGGSKWWQVRAGPGVEGEWIIMKKDWREYQANQRDLAAGAVEGPVQLPVDPPEDEDGNGPFRKEMDELRCMLYIHGGAYYWGSINTHRYTIWRYARKMHGRCFAVNYRKAPQYPFPCGLQDCLAAYLYLTRPPPEAQHKPVDPKKLVIGGDSAGAGLVLALLQVLRDTDGLELPAGAVVISPWSDLTHSFPSLLENTATDIVPPYGFLHKPSSLWPPPPPALTEFIQSKLRTRVQEAIHRSNEGEGPPEPNQTSGQSPKTEDDDDPPGKVTSKTSKLLDKLVASPRAATSQVPPWERKQNGTDAIETSKAGQEVKEGDPGPTTLHPISDSNDPAHQPQPHGEPRPNPSKVNPGMFIHDLVPRHPDFTDIRQTTLAQYNPPMELQVEDRKVVIDTQCQLYATNAQLCHPWVSPVLAYLGGLPPLFICAGNNEVLRDEIIYVAHKAANPSAHPVREDVKAMYPAMNGIEERYGPTNVHFQIYDGACHDLPLFSMTKPARGLFRAIASFARYVTPSAPGSLSISRSVTHSRTTSELSIAGTKRAATMPMTSIKSTSDTLSIPEAESLAPHSIPDSTDKPKIDTKLTATPQPETSVEAANAPSADSSSSSSDETAMQENSSSKTPYTVPLPQTVELSNPSPEGDDAGFRFSEDQEEGEEDPATRDSAAAPGTAGFSGIYRGQNPFKDHMIRERVAADGTCRPLEPVSELAAMQVPEDEICVIKEGPAMRYLNGQALWDKKFSHAIKKIQKQRRKNLREAKEKDQKKIVKMWKDRVKQHREEEEMERMDTHGYGAQDEGWDTDSDEGPSEAAGTSGDATAKKGRKPRERLKDKTGIDLPEEMLDQSWSWSWALQGEAPPPSAIVSRRDFGEARRLALMADRMDSAHDSPMHGLSIWVGLAAFFSSSSERDKSDSILKKVRETKKADRDRRKAGKIANRRADGDDSESVDSRSSVDGMSRTTTVRSGLESSGKSLKEGAKGGFKKMTRMLTLNKDKS